MGQLGSTVVMDGGLRLRRRQRCSGSMGIALPMALHNASTTVAASVSAFAYVYASANAGNPRFQLWKPARSNALGGFTGALLLAVFALFYGQWESVGKTT